jgi:hypothetical protein
MLGEVMKKWTLLSLLLGAVILGHPVLGDWVVDQQLKFKILVPNDWKRNILTDGTDRIHVFLSPDENVAVRIRAFKVNTQVKLDLIISLFESNILGDGERLALMDHTLNQYKGKVGAYKGTFNAVQVGAAAFFTIQDGVAYIIWSMTPLNLFQSRIDEADAITNTFTLLKDAGESTQTFSDDGLGYQIEYPADWTYTKSQPHIVIFSGKEGTPAYYATVNIQNLASSLMGGNFNSITQVLNHFQRQLFNGAEDIIMSGVEDVQLQNESKTILGRELTATYTRQGTHFKQRLIVFPRHDQRVFYAWIYTAPMDDYDDFLSIASLMLKSWQIK